jgi:hypothetical protein
MDGAVCEPPQPDNAKKLLIEVNPCFMSHLLRNPLKGSS